jgi:flagellar assembly protein FliH
MTAAPARFTFDLDLGRQQGHAEFMSDAARAGLVQAARTEGYAEGLAAGEHAAAAAAAQSLAAAATAIATQAAGLLTGLEAARTQSVRDAVTLAASIARKLAAGLVAQQPAVELEALLAECLSSLEGVPHLVIRCHPELAEAIRERAEARIAQSGFAGRLVVLGEPDIALGDGRIEWADGGLVRDMAAIEVEVEARITAYLAARGTTQEKTP